MQGYVMHEAGVAVMWLQQLHSCWTSCIYAEGSTHKRPQSLYIIITIFYFAFRMPRIRDIWETTGVIDSQPVA